MPSFVNLYNYDYILSNRFPLIFSFICLHWLVRILTNRSLGMIVYLVIFYFISSSFVLEDLLSIHDLFILFPISLSSSYLIFLFEQHSHCYNPISTRSTLLMPRQLNAVVIKSITKK